MAKNYTAGHTISAKSGRFLCKIPVWSVRLQNGVHFCVFFREMPALGTERSGRARFSQRCPDGQARDADVLCRVGRAEG